MLHYTIYKITNLINNKIYIGQHITNNLNDGYMGSGKNINDAMLKYGIENFKKEILYVFDNYEDMNQKEKELVTEEFCKRKDTYNILPGGFGNWNFINKNWHKFNANKENPVKILKERNDGSYEAFCKAISDANKNKPKSELHKKKTSEARYKFYKENPERKLQDIQPMINAVKNTIWITNGKDNKRIFEKDFYKYPEYKIGRCNSKNKDRFWIHHPIKNIKKMIYENQWEEYHLKGYIKGVGKRSRRSKSSIFQK